MKKMIVVLLMLGALLCGLFSSGAFAGKTLSMMIQQLNEADYIQQLLPEFEKKTGLKIELEMVEYGVMHAKLLPQLLSKEGSYDVIPVDNYWTGEFCTAGWLEPLDEYLAKTPEIDINAYIPSVMEMTGYWDGTLYMIPYYAYPMGIAYRTDLLADPQLNAEYQAKYGIPLRIPANVAEYVQLSRFMTRKVDGVQIYGNSMQGKKPDEITMEWSNYLFSLGGDYYDENWNPVINNEKGVRALELYVESMKHAAPSGSPGFGLDESLHMMLEGRAFSMISYAQWVLVQANDPAVSKVAGKVDIDIMPGGAGLNGSWGFAIPKSAPNKEASWKFISWVTSTEIAMKRASLGSHPTRWDVFTDYELVKQYPYYPKVMVIMSRAKPVPEFLYSTKMIEVTGRELSLAVEGKDPQEALNEVANELKNLAIKAGLYK